MLAQPMLDYRTLFENNAGGELPYCQRLACSGSGGHVRCL